MKILIVKLSPLSPNIRLGALFLNTLSLRFSLNVRGDISYSYSTTGNIIVLYILNFKFLEVEKTKVFGLNNNDEFPTISLHFISS